jgi:hypothetical protein
MTGSSPISIQGKGEPAPIVPAAIQIPKAMIPTEIEIENASFTMTSKDLCLPDGRQSVSKSASIRARQATSSASL